MSGEKTYFLPSTILKWNAIRSGKDNSSVPVTDTQSIGFVPAFESLEDLKKEFPDSEYTTWSGEPRKEPSK